MDWDKTVRLKGKLIETVDTYCDCSEDIKVEDLYQEFKKRLDRDRKIYPPVRFDPVNFGTVVINSRKTPCEHAFGKLMNGLYFYVPNPEGEISSRHNFCPNCGVKL